MLIMKDLTGTIPLLNMQMQLYGSEESMWRACAVALSTLKLEHVM